MVVIMDGSRPCGRVLSMRELFNQWFFAPTSSNLGMHCTWIGYVILEGVWVHLLYATVFPWMLLTVFVALTISALFELGFRIFEMGSRVLSCCNMLLSLVFGSEEYLLWICQEISEFDILVVMLSSCGCYGPRGYRNQVLSLEADAGHSSEILVLFIAILVLWVDLALVDIGCSAETMDRRRLDRGFAHCLLKRRSDDVGLGLFVVRSKKSCARPPLCSICDGWHGNLVGLFFFAGVARLPQSAISGIEMGTCCGLSVSGVTVQESGMGLLNSLVLWQFQPRAVVSDTCRWSLHLLGAISDGCNIRNVNL
ncbi:hypothetical protein Nepgr_021704 [Nepenthes gracilis]|uniref:Transmembrane protein n=1 Tax=Nepenthes gracilis TaxID=150966 RepID=A0AAD3SX88_NEPGR|nr:hypothetical protein Nepgr_021704 [Nepenthes gracilis]